MSTATRDVRELRGRDPRRPLGGGHSRARQASGRIPCVRRPGHPRYASWFGDAQAAIERAISVSANWKGEIVRLHSNYFLPVDEADELTVRAARQAVTNYA